jgi:hypothetical protein
MRKTSSGGNKSDGADGGRRTKDLTIFSRAVDLFNSGKFDQAKQLFEELASTPDASIADAARSRARICEQRSREA